MSASNDLGVPFTHWNRPGSGRNDEASTGLTNYAARSAEPVQRPRADTLHLRGWTSGAVRSVSRAPASEDGRTFATPAKPPRRSEHLTKKPRKAEPSLFCPQIRIEVDSARSMAPFAR